MDVDEPGDDHVDDHKQDGIVPEVGEPDSLSQDEPGHQEHGSHAEHMGGKSVMFHGGLGSNESWASLVDLLALSGGIAERNAGHVDVGVSIGPDKIEEASAAAAGVVAGGSKLRAAGLRVADQQFD